MTPRGQLLVRGSVNIDGTSPPSLSLSDVFDLIFTLALRIEFFVVEQ